MDEGVIILFFLLILITVLALSCIGLFVVVRWFVRRLSDGRSGAATQTLSLPSQPPMAQQCVNCEWRPSAGAQFCPICGARFLTKQQDKSVRDLEITLLQITRMHDIGAIDQVNFLELRTRIEKERELIIFPNGRPGMPAQAPLAASDKAAPATPPIAKQPIASSSEEHFPPSLFTPPPLAEPAAAHAPFAAEIPTETTRAPRKPFSEVLAAFMEQSNIRWGEIIGGLLIIGCSTALVVSLWAQISRIPVLKFLIFTTVTAALFGVGFYTEHRWKLPTTSRGILTIATLLVPLNFLAIAAVSGSTIPAGTLVIGSELIAPAVFLCLVYFAGRVITPGCAHLLSAGVLGSSVGQLLVRHFAASDIAPSRLILLGAFPLMCYVLTVGLALRAHLTDCEIDESETTTVFTMLGTMSFAALLPFALLLYKTGPLGLTMMYLAPLVTLSGLPLLAAGTVLWRRINNKKLVASRTAGTAIGLLGVAIVLAGMFLAWPNPASIVPAALLNFAVFTVLAVALDLPFAHLLGAGCFGLAYLVLFHVLAGHAPWQNLRVASLLDL